MKLRNGYGRDIIVNELQRKPEIVVFAGPNGSGKSTFTALLKPMMNYINADEIKKNLKCSDYEAAELAEKQREEHLQNMDNFCFETVMSTDRNLKLLKKAKEKIRHYGFAFEGKQVLIGGLNGDIRNCQT